MAATVVLKVSGGKERGGGQGAGRRSFRGKITQNRWSPCYRNTFSQLQSMDGHGRKAWERQERGGGGEGKGRGGGRGGEGKGRGTS